MKVTAKARCQCHQSWAQIPCLVTLHLGGPLRVNMRYRIETFNLSIWQVQQNPTRFCVSILFKRNYSPSFIPELQ